MTALEPAAGGSAPPLTRTYVLVGAIAATVIYVAVLVFGLVIAAAVVGEERSEASGVLRMAAIIAASAIGFGLAPWLMLRARGATVAFGSLRPAMSDFGLALLGFVGALVAVYAYVLIVRAAGLDSLEPVSTISNDDFYEHVSVVVLLGISAVIVAPVAEEMFFRGFLVGALGRAWSAPIALLSSSAIFAALHFDIGSMIPFALVGLVFGALYLRTGGIAAPVLAHLGFNLVGYFGSLANQGVL